MLNKKNIAKAMAAATVFTAVAPTSFAAQSREVIENVQEKEIKEVKAKVYKLFNTKYTSNTAFLQNTDLAGDSVYTVRINGSGAISSYSEFERNFDKVFAQLKNGETIEISYEALNGFNELEDGQIVDVAYSTYTNAGLKNDLDNTTGTKYSAVSEYLGAKYETEILDDGNVIGKLPISNGEFITVGKGDTIVNLNNPKFKVVDGYYVDEKNNPIKLFDETSVTDFDTVKELTKLGGVVEGYYPATTKTFASVVGTTATKIVLVKSLQATNKEALTVGELYEKSIDRLTVKGNELRKTVLDILEDEKSENKDNLKFDVIITNNAGIKTTVTSEKNHTMNGLESLLANRNIKNIKIVFSTNIDEEDSTYDWTPVYELTVTQGRNESFSDLYTAIAKSVYTKTLAGTDRYKTAVELSKEQFGKGALAGSSVILVSGDESKLVDGLTATPLAAKLGAPILLTQSGTINEDTLKEIKRLGAKNVVIVGGESAVNESVKNELKTVHGLDVTRLSGDSREETSMAVANKIASLSTSGSDTTAKFNEVFVVGSKGEADALSAAAIAAKKQVPILLTPAGKLDKDVKHFINKNVIDTNNKVDVYIVGGTNSVNASVQSELVKIGVNNKENDNIEAKRLAGVGRQDTNAAVITEFKSDLNDIVVAKSDNKGMVDALAAGVYAAATDSHIVLATNALTEDQEDAIAEVKKANTIDNLVQAGYNVAKDVIAKIRDLIK